MNALSHPLIQKNTLINLLIDFSALAFIYLVPTFSHFLSLPVYLIEPMRLMLILALTHTNKKNAYLLALSMPAFSYIISGHPLLPKMMLIAFELSLNVFLFHLFTSKFKNVLVSVLLSITISKVFYYILKFSLIKLTLFDSELFSTPILIQLLTTFVFSLYVYMFFKKKE